MEYWLVKSEPEECGIDDFVKKGREPICWDGIRNYQARNFLRAMSVGDAVFLYHSSCRVIGIAGTLEVTREAYPDPLQFDSESSYFDPASPLDEPRWTAVDLRLVRSFPRIVERSELQLMHSFSDSVLTRRGSRLSVMPVTGDQWREVLGLVV